MYKISNLSLANALAVPTQDNTTAVWTTSINQKLSEDFGVWLKFASSGTVNVKVLLEQSWTTPTTQNATDSNWAVPDGYAPLGTFTDTLAHIVPVSPVIMQHLRLKLIGMTGNSATTTVTIYVGRQEQLGSRI